jgi:hypothetical protein
MLSRLLVLFVCLTCWFSLSAQKSLYWKKSALVISIPQEMKKSINPAFWSGFVLDMHVLRNEWLAAARGYYFEADKKGLQIELPMPDGSFQLFKVVMTDVMHPSLAARYPAIKTFAGMGVTDPSATVRIDITPKGLHGMILSPQGAVFIEPISVAETQTYISYFKKDNQTTDYMSCELVDIRTVSDKKTLSVNRSIAGSLRTYRTAVATTGEYTRFHGGTVADGLAAVVTTINRVTGVYETEVGVRLELIPNNDLIIYTNSQTDPYSNNGGSTLLGQNQTNLDNVIGNSNYDIGHVFTTGGGGVANLGSVCRNSRKAEGTSGRNNPEGDKFDIDYVAHEMGHQFNAEHTFNATTSSCNGNRTASSAYEPGSGITILGYAGICGINNLANNSIAWFHARSFSQIVTFTTTGSGGNCGTLTLNSNQAPVINTLPANFSIPLNTPFSLTGASTDPDGDAITYSWEQFNTGPAGDWDEPSGNAPIFMSMAPTASGTRSFPSLTNVLNNTNSKGDLKPSYARTLSFRLTVRDNRGGVTNNDNLVVLNVVNTVTPFEITTGNTALTIPGGTTQTIRWNVSSTNLAPINCTSVDITASLDGGLSFPFIVANNVPNTGEYTYNIPNINSSNNVRIKITARDNVFYDINNANLSIVPSIGKPLAEINSSLFQQKTNEQLLVYPNPAKQTLTIERGLQEPEFILLKDGAGSTIATITWPKGQNKLVWNLPSGIANGFYYLCTNHADKPVIIQIFR